MLPKVPGFLVLLAAVALVFLPESLILAQGLATEDHLSLDFLRPQIVAGFSDVSARLFKNLDGTYDATSVTLEAAIPVYQDFSPPSDRLTSYLLIARGQFSAVKPEISFLTYSRSLYLSTVGLTGGIRTPSGHLYLLTLNAGAAEDDEAISHPRIRPTGSLLGKYQLKDSFSFIYGISYSYAFDRGLLLPMLGAHCVLGEDFEMHVVLPYSFELEYEEIQNLLFGLVVRANGNQVHINDDRNFPPQSLPLYLKSAQVQAAFSVSVGLGQHWWLCGEAGVARDRNLAIGTLDHNLVSSKIENAGYSSLIIKYVIDSSDSWLW
jgi:hypothetical protein